MAVLEIICMVLVSHLMLLLGVCGETVEERVNKGDEAYKAYSHCQEAASLDPDNMSAVDVLKKVSRTLAGKKVAEGPKEPAVTRYAATDLSCKEAIIRLRNVLHHPSDISNRFKMTWIVSYLGEPYASCEDRNGTNYCFRCLKKDGTPSAVYASKDYATQDFRFFDDGCPCDSE